MTRVGTFEAKTHLTHLLERVAKGERIAITNRGKPVAMLVPFDTENERDTARMGRDARLPGPGKAALGSGPFRRIAHEGHRY